MRDTYTLNHLIKANSKTYEDASLSTAILIPAACTKAPALRSNDQAKEKVASVRMSERTNHYEHPAFIL